MEFIFAVFRTKTYKLQLTKKIILQQGFQHLHILPDVAIVTHLTISILLLLVSTWIYGRERFQCDLQFMLGKTISNFKIFLLRFLTPFFLGFCIVSIACNLSSMCSQASRDDASNATLNFNSKLFFCHLLISNPNRPMLSMQHSRMQMGTWIRPLY